MRPDHGGTLPHATASYHGALDGIRALSIVAVLLFHGGVRWAGGGFLGVEAFFVLSGFLITSLLVREWQRSSTIAVRAFWGRRARRLLPALVVLVLVIGLYYANAGADNTVPGLKADGLATLLYVGNWHQIAVGSNYFVANGPVSPLQHTWSLAIEEQFYLLWPLVVLGTLFLCGRRGRSRTRRPLAALLALSVVGVFASALDAALRLHAGAGLDRVYYGTDSRAASLLLGASLAVGLAVFAPDAGRRSGGESSKRGRWRWSVLPVVALGAVLAMMHLADSGSVWLYPYGLLGLDLAVATIIAAVVLAPRSPLARGLSLPPIRAIGIISYGIYLWHFPLFLWLNASSAGVSGTTLLVLRLVVTLLVSLASFYAIEQPVRRRRVPTWLVRPLVPVAVGGAVVALLVASSVGSTSLGLAAVPPVARTTAWLRGTGPACRVRLNDTKHYGLSPLSPSQAAQDEPAWLAGHQLKWNGSSRRTFHVCPPKRVLLIGDSIAFTLGVGFMEGEERYGLELANAAILGCAFNDRGDLNLRGTWEVQPPGCRTALARWSEEERSFHADAVIVELGYRDEFDWRWNGRVVRMGQPVFDSYVRQRIDRYVQVLGHGRVPILFLSVPWANPAPLPNGSPAPAASAARHTVINSMLSSAAAANPGLVQVLDIDKPVGAEGHYESRVNGKLCRFDGVHFTVFCSRLLQPAALRAIRAMIRGSEAARQR
jgi:peptidoglycan/LPS O-acetylase OafA/YrhL